MTQSIEKDIQEWFIHHKKTLSAAESCTGGSLAAKLTRIPGASNYFLGSVVAYSNELKSKVLGVSPELIKKYGAVSSEAVEAMAKGTLHLTGSDFTVAVTGIAGPSGGTLDKPVGTVWGCIANQKGLLYSWQFHIEGNRDHVIEGSVDAVLKELFYRNWESELKE
jgi:PncC family amidohydrolase